VRGDAIGIHEEPLSDRLEPADAESIEVRVSGGESLIALARDALGFGKADRARPDVELREHFPIGETRDGLIDAAASSAEAPRAVRM
jgi:hypothetical protein